MSSSPPTPLAITTPLVISPQSTTSTLSPPLQTTISSLPPTLLINTTSQSALKSSITAPPTTITTIPTQPDWRHRYLPFFYEPKWTMRAFCGDDHWDIAKPYIIGCGSAMYAQFAVLPLLNLKVFSQVLDRPINNIEKSSKLRNTINYLKTYGFFHLWRGFPAAFQGQFIGTFAHLHFIRNTHDQPTPLNYSEAITTTTLAMSLAALAYSPFDLIVARQQADVLLPHQHQRQYKSLYSAIPRIITQESPFALFKGVGFGLFRSLTATGVVLSLFPFLTGQFQQKNTAIDTLCYLTLAITSSLVLHPLDTMKVIRQVTPVTDNNKNVGPIRSYIKRNGIRSLYRGAIPASLANVGVPVLTYLLVDLLARSKIMK